MPEEGQPHKRTWMAFGASQAIWGRGLLPRVRHDLATIATTVARFEPVWMLVRPNEVDMARSLVEGANVELVVAEIDDLWIRDTGPVFVRGNGIEAGVDFNFNGWGGKQRHRKDAGVAVFVNERAGVETVHTEPVMEGGGIEIDGDGTAIATESCILNPNRNPGWSKSDVESELDRLLGVEKVIWLPGVVGQDITDGHADFYARSTRPGVAVATQDNDQTSSEYALTRNHLEILRAATDAHGRPLTVEVIDAPTNLRYAEAAEVFAAGHINFYVCNGAVIAPDFGDPDTDRAAKEKLSGLFPDREIVQIAIDGLAAGGGGIHCATLQEPED